MKARNHLRVPLALPVRIKISERDDEFIDASLGDISWGGAYVITDPLPEVGSRIIIQFVMSDEGVSLELWGNVVRIGESEDMPPGVGVEFDTLDYDAQSLIQAMVYDEITELFKNAAKSG